MKYIEQYADIFTPISSDKNPYYAQCISADLGMKSGIAVVFNYHYNSKRRLKDKYPHTLWKWFQTRHSFCLKDAEVFHIVTKSFCWLKPSLQHYKEGIEALAEEVKKHPGIKTLVIPPLGCGIDGMKYQTLKKHINHYFQDMDITIICRTNSKRFARRYFEKGYLLSISDI